MMKKTYVLLVLASVLTTMLGTVNCDDNKKCKQENMEYSDCGSACPTTCQDIARIGERKVCTAVCKPGCSCKEGHALHNGKCIPQEECLCQRNAEFKECGGACQLTCEDVASMVPKACPWTCFGGCACKDGYVLISGKCIPQEECPCKRNAQYDECGTCRKTCKDVANSITDIACPKICQLGCFCNEGYVLHDTECVLEKDCPCDSHAHYDLCGTACPLTCDNYTNPPEVCIEICVPGCFCDEGYVRSGKACVLPEQCPRTTAS